MRQHHRRHRGRSEPEGPPSLSEFSAEEWKSWAADAGSGLATFIALIVVALILGWLVMRETSDLEEEAKEAAETYTDIEDLLNLKEDCLGWTTTSHRLHRRSSQRMNVAAMTAAMCVR